MCIYDLSNWKKYNGWAISYELFESNRATCSCNIRRYQNSSFLNPIPAEGGGGWMTPPSYNSMKIS